MTNPADSGSSRFPSLPIISPPEPARSEREKYGSLLYLGLAGLVVLVGLVGWFAYRTWSMREVWSNIYILNDPRASEEKRVEAAHRLSRDRQVEPNQLWDLSLNRKLPELARYALAEGIGPDLVAQDPLGYASAVARSPDWPEWLRLVLVRPLAYAATQGHSLSRERLGELCRHSGREDQAARLWALYTLAVQTRPDPQTKVELERVAHDPGPYRELAQLFVDAVGTDEAHRFALLDRATTWNREHHPDTRRLWQGWTIREGGIVRSQP